MSKLNPAVERVTARIIARSKDSRQRYLDLIAREAEQFPGRGALSCSNLAHGFAAALDDKSAIKSGQGANLAIVTAYHDMLSAHQPYGRYPEAIEVFKKAVSLTPGDANAHFGLGLSYLSTKNRSLALEQYKILKTLDADMADELFDRIYR